MTKSNKKTWDVFISYASEDREDVAAPLSNILKAFGLSVWIDQTELKVGDSLRRKIDEGLSCSRYGIVVLSPSFLQKHYTNVELNGMAQMEVDGKKVILPVWHNVDAEIIRQYSPSLADRVALKYQDGIPYVAAKLLEVIRPDLLQRHVKIFEGSKLSNITTGEQLRNILAGSESSLFYHDELKDEHEINLVASFLDELRDWIDIWEDLSIKEQAEAQISFSQRIDDLLLSNWSIWCGRKTIAYHITDYSGKDISVPSNAIIVDIVRGKPQSVIHSEAGVVVKY